MVDDGGKTNKDTDWRFQAPLNPQVLLPLMAQRGTEVVGETVLVRKSKSIHRTGRSTFFFVSEGNLYSGSRCSLNNVAKTVEFQELELRNNQLMDEGVIIQLFIEKSKLEEAGILLAGKYSQI